MKIEIEIPDAMATAIVEHAPEILRRVSSPEKNVKSWVHGAVVKHTFELFASAQAMTLLQGYRAANNLTNLMFQTPGDRDTGPVS